MAHINRHENSRLAEKLLIWMGIWVIALVLQFSQFFLIADPAAAQVGTGGNTRGTPTDNFRESLQKIEKSLANPRSKNYYDLRLELNSLISLANSAKGDAKKRLDDNKGIDIYLKNLRIKSAESFINWFKQQADVLSKNRKNPLNGLYLLGKMDYLLTLHKLELEAVSNPAAVQNAKGKSAGDLQAEYQKFEALLKQQGKEVIDAVLAYAQKVKSDTELMVKNDYRREDAAPFFEPIYAAAKQVFTAQKMMPSGKADKIATVDDLIEFSYLRYPKWNLIRVPEAEVNLKSLHSYYDSLIGHIVQSEGFDKGWQHATEKIDANRTSLEKTRDDLLAYLDSIRNGATTDCAILKNKLNKISEIDDINIEDLIAETEILGDIIQLYHQRILDRISRRGSVELIHIANKNARDVWYGYNRLTRALAYNRTLRNDFQTIKRTIETRMMLMACDMNI